MPHHWYNGARAEQEGHLGVAAEREAAEREIVRLKRELEIRDSQISALKSELQKLKRASSPKSKQTGKLATK